MIVNVFHCILNLNFKKKYITNNFFKDIEFCFVFFLLINISYPIEN